MTKGNWITIAIFTVGIVTSALTLAIEVGKGTAAIEANTTAIRDLDHTWAVRIQADEAELATLRERVARLEGPE